MAEPESSHLGVRLDIPERVIEEIAARAAQIVQDDLARTGEKSEWLNVREAADYLRCTPQRIYDLRSNGRLPRTTEGGRALIRRTDLDAVLAIPRRRRA